MIRRIDDLLGAMEGRYPSPEEQAAWLAYAGSVSTRFKVIQSIAEAEEAAVRQAIEEIRRRYPDFDRYHYQGWSKCFRDVQLVVRACAQAMLFDDVNLLETRVLFWLRSILAASNFPPGIVRDTYTLVREGFRQRLPADAFSLFEPFLNRTVEVLSDFSTAAPAAV